MRSCLTVDLADRQMMILPSVLTLRSVESSHFESSSKPWAELPKCQDDIRFKWLCVILVKPCGYLKPSP